MSPIESRIESLSRTPVLLVATDYDGTLAPIVADPAQAHPHREAIVALRSLAALPHTHVAVVSGRSLSNLAELSGAPEHVHLVGSHGSEFDPGFADSLSETARNLRSDLERGLDEIARRASGLALERKPAGVAFHYRSADEQDAAAAVQAVLAGPAATPGVQTRHGKKVIELSVVPTNKGQALDSLRQRFGVTAAVYLGDDETDEDAFARLFGPDLSVKVGEGETRAEERIGGPIDVARLLARLAELREAWLLGADAQPIEEHALLSDQRAVALVAPDARITWMCAPRIDSSAIFSELLDPNAGVFAVQAADGSPPLLQSLVKGTLILQTRWRELTVTDYLDCSQGRPTQRAGRTDLLRVIEGRGRARIEFAPRLDFGRTQTELEAHPEGLEVTGVVEAIVLVSPGVEWEIRRVGPHHSAFAEVALDGGPVVLELRVGTKDLTTSTLAEHERQRRTRQFWLGWAERLHLPRTATDLALTSALVLRGLVYGPTGAIAAAATTSLPECPGGVRNWDYRYAWLRDAALSAEALVALGSLREAMRFLDWVLGIVEELPHPERLRPLYTVTGHELGPEGEIGELAGYAGSRPVRVGNAASQQVQLDVFGPIANLVEVLCEAGAPLSFEHWKLVERMAAAVVARWREPDHGIWELRGRPRHHVHSKVMCWMTLDRATRIAERFRGGEGAREWPRLRDEIAAEVIERGWNERRDAFTGSYGSEDLDAAALWVGLSGLLPGDDPRFRRTVEATMQELLQGPTVFRYRFDDGLPGREGGFHICLSWLIEALVLVGRVGEARTLFGELTARAGRTGFLSEQVDPTSLRALGNHPQAYSHLGLIKNAVLLDRHPRPRSPEGPRSPSDRRSSAQGVQNL